MPVTCGRTSWVTLTNRVPPADAVVPLALEVTLIRHCSVAGGIVLSRMFPSACPRLTRVSFPSETWGTMPTAAPSVEPDGVVDSSDAGWVERASTEEAAAQGIVAVRFCGWKVTSGALTGARCLPFGQVITVVSW